MFFFNKLKYTSYLIKEFHSSNKNYYYYIFYFIIYFYIRKK